MDQDKSVLSQITCQRDSQRRDSTDKGTCLRDKINKARKRAAVVSTSNINDYLQYVYEQ
jgi:hypothetical protein